jgi:hypothetical protein
MARVNKLSQAQVALVQKGDMVRAEAINVDLAKAQEDYKKILDEGDSAQQMAAAGEIPSRDLQMTIIVKVNANVESSSGAKSLPLPPGARAAFRSTIREDAKEDQALILLGQWTPTAESGWKSLRRASVTAPAAHVISIHIVADANRLAPTVDSIDVKSLATLLN